MHEIVTIQLGRRANYLATHYWNAQDSYQTFAPAPPSIINHDVHFRQGLSPDGTETYLPRTLIYDLKSGFGSLARTNVLGNEHADETATATSWNGNMTRLPSIPQSEPSPYAKSLLDSAEPVLPTISTTPFFADFASTYYHPRSLIPITPPYPTSSATGQAQPTAFAASGTAQSSSFEAGIDLFTSRDQDVDILDTDMRLWLEECDGLQAVQIFTSSDDSWAGFATQYVERLRDELGKGCIWVWGIDQSAVAYEPGNEKRSQAQRREQSTNTALAVHSLAEQASMFVPLSIPNTLNNLVDIDRRSLWHTSALLESAIESVTLPTRLNDKESSGCTLRDWQDVLSGGGRRTISQLSMAPDFKVQKNKKDVRMRTEDTEVDITGDSTSNIDFSVAGSIKSTRRIKRFSKIEIFRANQDTLDKVLSNYQAPERGDPIETYSVDLAFPQLPTFPTIFRGKDQRKAESPRFHASIQTTSEVAQWVRQLQNTVRLSMGTNIGGQEKEAVYSLLGDIAEKYIEDWDSADESEEDD